MSIEACELLKVLPLAQLAARACISLECVELIAQEAEKQYRPTVRLIREPFRLCEESSDEDEDEDEDENVSAEDDEIEVRNDGVNVVETVDNEADKEDGKDDSDDSDDDDVEAAFQITVGPLVTICVDIQIDCIDDFGKWKAFTQKLVSGTPCMIDICDGDYSTVRFRVRKDGLTLDIGWKPRVSVPIASFVPFALQVLRRLERRRLSNTVGKI